MVARFHPGDRVRIRQWDDMAAEYMVDADGDIEGPLHWFGKKMDFLCGLESVVVNVEEYYDGYEYILDDESSKAFAIFDWMLEPVSDPDFDSVSEEFQTDRFFDLITKIKE